MNRVGAQPQGRADAARTGAVPYLHNTAEGIRRSGNTQTGMKPVQRRRKRTKGQMLLDFIFTHQKAVLVSVICFLLVCIAVPVAVIATTVNGNGSEADFEMIADGYESNDVLNAGDVVLNGMPPLFVTTDEGTTAPNEAPITDEETTSEETTSEDESSEDEGAEEPEEAVGFTVTIQFYDRDPITCTTGTTTLRQIMNAAGYPILDSERPSVDYDAVIDGDAWISVDKVEYKSVTVSEAIPFETETYEVQTIPRGTYQTATYGKNGSRDTVYTVEYLNGVEVSRTKEYDYVALYPTNQVNYYGTGGTFYAPDGTAYSYSYYVTVRATYYNIHGTTASGMPTGHNVIATDPSVFPLGTKMYVINDYFDMGVRIAADTGGAVKGNLIDIWMDETNPYYEQFAFGGVWEMKAYILD